MISALGHCEDPQCAQSSANHDLVRLFRCTIHCDRLLCLYHLNAHDVYYEEEKKQNAVVLNELQNSLTLYQSIFEQQLAIYRELVHQASALLLQNTSALVPIEQIRPVLERIQKAIAIFQQEKIIIKSETELDGVETDVDKNDSNSSKEQSSVKKEINTPVKVRPVVRLERVELNRDLVAERRLHDEHMNRNYQHDCSTRCRVEENNSRSKDSSDDITIECISSITDGDGVHSSKSRKSTDENYQSRIGSPNCSGKKKCDKVKKKNDKTITLKRLQT
ncbi:unnamed protein product [Adineta ricciae]|uniref:Uncharacterized protein n=1 Tax=Adineta ricciae TaxID=249248 RepID=A0A815QH84_ADIRI|nr:unnamed protein product [Adineta ricciae]